MASASPAVQPVRGPGPVDFRKTAEYPIVLGETLKDNSAAANQYIDLRFNWQPKAGFKETESKLRRTNDGFRLNVNDTTSSETAYRYTGHDRQLSRDGEEADSFVLVFDKKRSVFVLESIGNSIDLNLEAAASLSKEDISRRPQIPKVSQTSAEPSKSSRTGNDDDDQPDPNNPFDFRNFLDEAKETIDKTAGHKSPMPGSRTPMSGFASPALGATRFTPAITQPLPKESKTPNTLKPKTDTPPKRKTIPPPKQDRKPPTSTSARQPTRNQPLSNERISDSDDELSDAPVRKSPSSKPASKPPAPTTKGHTRHPSANIGHSPHIVVNDGDLEIDMGSPPQEATNTRKRRTIDAEAFRSHTGTPVLGQSPRLAAPVTSSSNRYRGSGDVEMKEAPARSTKSNGSDDDEDDDVDALELGSPRTTRREASLPPPTPPSQLPQHQSEDDEVAELEDLLGGDEDDADTSMGGTGGMGLGISGAAAGGVGVGAGVEDDSEVSEEE